MLIVIKFLHTIVWAFRATSIVALPITGALGRFRWAAMPAVLILLECGVVAINGGRCPLTDLAAHFTQERADNFDIYLPVWLARHNKSIFGALFVADELVVPGCWFKEKHSEDAVGSTDTTRCARGSPSN